LWYNIVDERPKELLKLLTGRTALRRSQ